MTRQLETTFLTRKQHDAILDAFRDGRAASRQLFRHLSFQWSLAGALVHGEPGDIARLREFVKTLA